MHLRLHVPSSIDAPDDWSTLQRERLQKVIARAFTRAVSNLNLPSVQVELVLAPEQQGTNAATNTSVQKTQDEQGDVKERLDASRVRDGAYYRVPGYDSGGRPVDIPIHVGGEETIGTTEGDTIDLGDFPHLAVIQGLGNTYIYVGGRPYVKAQNLARAMQWGAYLFGGSGYAVLQPKGASPDGPFYVAHLLVSPKLKGETESFALESGEKVVGIDARMIHLQDYLSVVVVDSSGNLLFGNRLNDPWNLAMYKRALTRVPGNQRVIDKASVREISGLLLSHAARARGDEGIVEIIVKMDRTLFAAMPWEKRVEYLVLLLDAWTNEREEIAILEIIHATHSESELEAIFALLREHDRYEKLFDDLDGRVFELLQMLGEYRTGRPLDWHYLVELLIEMEFMPSLLQNPEQELERLAGGLLDWLQSTWDGIRFLVTRPDEVLEGLGHLAELLWIVQKAQYGDPQAQAFITRMVVEAGTAMAKAIRGLQYAEELGTPYGHRGGGVNISAGILGRLQAALLFEILSWFIGIGEIRAAVRAAGTLPERLAALMDVLRSLRLLGKAAEVGTEAAKVERILIALVHLAEVGEEARIVRLAEFLPQEHLALLERIAQSVELPQGAGIDALRTALRGKTELLKGVEQLGDALHVIGRVEARAGELTAEMTKGLHMLLQHTGWNRATLINLIEDIPAANLPEFLHTMTFVKPTYLQKWGLQAFKDLAARPRVLTFIREAGSDLLEVAFGHSGRSWEKFDLFLEGLAAERSRIGNATEYQRLLDRLGKGEASAFDQVADAAHAQRLAEAVQKGETTVLGLQRLREGNHRHLLEELQEIAERDMTLHDLRASQLAELKDKELAGLEQIARLESGEADWGDVLDNVLQWTASDRGDLLGLVADIGPHTREGLDTVLRGIISRNVKKTDKMVTGVQGSWGQLYAARTLINRYGASGLRFEVAATRREIDIVAQSGSGWLHVEVKTNLENLAGEAAASFEEGQIMKDLVTHARTDYNDLLYLYHPDVASQLEGHGQRMLRLFDGDELPKLLKQQGIDVNKARQSFQHWLANGGLTTFNL